MKFKSTTKHDKHTGKASSSKAIENSHLQGTSVCYISKVNRQQQAQHLGCGAMYNMHEFYSLFQALHVQSLPPYMLSSLVVVLYT